VPLICQIHFRQI